MGADISATTAREYSSREAAARRPALTWFWPRYRLDWLNSPRLEIGRDDAAAIQLLGAGVSRRHAEVYRQGPVLVAHDLGSTNGTWLNGRRIERAPLEPGNVIRVGDWVGMFTEREASTIEFTELAPGIYGGSELSYVLALLKRAAPSNVPIMLVGDTGTGKERMARAVHHFSGRTGPLLAVNCAALPEHLAEAELFGYRRGAFTGAERNSPGHFRAADGGTLFLDEMPDLSPALQAKLLRTVETGEVLSIGDSIASKVDVRVVSASQLPLRELMEKKRIRQDLAARLRGLELRLPPLAARRADIAPLFMQFLTQQSGGRPPNVEARLIEALCLHDWPQNVRELELVSRTLLAVHGQEGLLKREHLGPEIAELCPDRSLLSAHASRANERREADLARLEQELETRGGNVKATAQALGISRQRIYRLLSGKVADFRKSAEGNGDDDDDPCA